MNLEVKLCRTTLKNPTVLASGYYGVAPGSLVAAAKAGAGAVTTKSCSLKPRKPHANPTVIAWEWGIMNAVGLSNPGVEEEIEVVKQAVKEAGVPVIASVFGETKEQIVEAAVRIGEAKPALIEVNASCPHVKSSIGTISTFSTKPEVAGELAEAVKNAVKTPVIFKLTPNVADIAGVAKAVEEAGADAIAAINTVGAMRIDIRARKPVLSAGKGGLSGPAVKPIAVKSVYEITRAVSIPVIGIGGVVDGEDAVEMLMAGATAVGIGSAIYYRGIGAFGKITQEIEEFMKENGFKKLSELKMDE